MGSVRFGPAYLLPISGLAVQRLLVVSTKEVNLVIKAVRLAVFIGAITLSWFASERPSYAIVDCSTRWGAACYSEGDFSRCYYYDEDMQCTSIYPCWCDRAYGPLQWRCGPNPESGNCI